MVAAHLLAFVRPIVNLRLFSFFEKVGRVELSPGIVTTGKRKGLKRKQTLYKRELKQIEKCLVWIICVISWIVCKIV